MTDRFTSGNSTSKDGIKYQLVSRVNASLVFISNFYLVFLAVCWDRILNPQKDQSRHLLLMDYSRRDCHRDSSMGLMDCALEHFFSYYDSSNSDLIYVEKYQKVCILAEFQSIIGSKHAYETLFQFFKTVFYVSNEVRHIE